MQGFQGKKEHSEHLLSHFLVLRDFPLRAIGGQARFESNRDGWKAHELTTRLRQAQHYVIKMSYLDQMYEKKAIEGYI